MQHESSGLKPITVSIAEACRLTGLGKSSLYKLIQSKKIQRLKHGEKTLIVYISLEEYILQLT